MKLAISKVFFGLFFVINSISYAQSQNKEILFTIDDKPYYTDEFVRVYNKNLDLVKDESQKDLDRYLDLFIGYKLKINKANKLGLQNNNRYINELKSYRTQLSKSYTSDTKVTNALIEEGYNRLKKEIKASHILFLVDENASPADTLKAYNQALDIRKKALSGEDFATLALQYSQDPSAKENKGDLGYFSAFRMVYPFENTAYKTPKNQISLPVRTKFGYHLIKVEDVRDNRGEVTVEHIMILKPTTNEVKEDEKAKKTIQDIYAKLNQGENFESLAKQFSEDKNSALKGGLLPKFSSGQLSSEEFENASFGLKEPNSYTEPFQSQFGWHIVKLIEKNPIKTLPEMERELDAKIRKDDRSRLITNSLVEKLRKKYTIVRDEKLYTLIKSVVTDKFYSNEWNLPENKKDFNKPLFKIENKEITGLSFLAFLEAKQKNNLKIKPLFKLIDQLYTNFVEEQITNYYNDNLEKEFPEFENVMTEYRDGLLLFDLMEKEIWDRAKQDTLGLKNYFETNRTNYQWKKRAEVLIVSSTKEPIIKKAKAFLKNNKSIDFIKQTLNTNGEVNVMIKEETLEENSPAIPATFKFNEGLSPIYKDGNFYFINKVLKVIPAGNKTLDETRGKLINDYQQYLEDNWVANLKKEFKININENVFAKVKTELKK
jgi:peptidyl-prolyl cis-trans isomerase SurA